MRDDDDDMLSEEELFHVVFGLVQRAAIVAAALIAIGVAIGATVYVLGLA